jgi:putative phage-type endonuclease
MRVIQLTQGTPEWLEYRLKMRNASETAAVMGVSPWMTPYQLWLHKTGRSTTKATVAMQHGTDLEPAARAAYEAQTGAVMQPLVVQDGSYSASLDGIDFDGQLILEIKCPYKGQASVLWNDAVVGAVPEHYSLQVQHQLMVAGATQAHLWVFDGAQGLLLPIDRDEAAIDRIRAAWEAFQPCLDTDTPPALTDADTVHRDDASWAAAAAAFAEAKRNADAQAEQLEAARLALIALAQHPREQGAGVSVTRFWKAGSVSYAKIPVLKGLDLSSYRGKTREEVRVTATA